MLKALRDGLNEQEKTNSCVSLSGNKVIRVLMNTRPPAFIICLGIIVFFETHLFDSVFYATASAHWRARCTLKVPINQTAEVKVYFDDFLLMKFDFYKWQSFVGLFN